MPEVKVLIATSMPPQLLADLSAPRDGVTVTVLSEGQRALLRPGLSANQEPDAAELRRLLAESEVIFVSFDAPSDLLSEAKRVRWIHTMGAGVENLIEHGFGRGAYVFTNGSGPHATSLSESIVLQALMLIKSAPAYLRFQMERKWARVGVSPRRPHFELSGRTVGIVGLGDIGLAAAERFHALGCRVVASRRSIDARAEHVGPVDELLPASDLIPLLEQSDIVVLSLPLTPETHHLINAETLRHMKPTAFLINIARGGVIDEAALIEALREERIAGASLDVFEKEPLPAESPLWGMENVIVTPHVSTTSENFLRRQVDLFQENLRRYLAGEPLLNVVDADRGY